MKTIKVIPSDDINAYIDGKTKLVIDILRAEGMSEESMQRIMKIIKIK